MKQWLMLAAAGMLAAAVTVPAIASPVATSLPTLGTTDWTTGAFDVASVGTAADGSTVLSTAPYRGVWYGYGTSYGYFDASSNYHPNVPSWTPGSPSAGNYLSLKASFSGSSYGPLADWSAYFLDTQYEAAMIFAPTACGCYGVAGAPGVDIYFAKPGSPNQFVSQFIPLDLSLTHTFEFLLKGGLVSYRIDGQAYSGNAGQVGYFGPLLVIGDGSGSTGTGVGEMTIRASKFDNAPTENVLLSSVPEPATWAMLLAGFALAGTAMRRRSRGLALD